MDGKVCDGHGKRLVVVVVQTIALSFLTTDPQVIDSLQYLNQTENEHCATKLGDVDEKS